MITQEELKEVLHYEPLTGTFTWVKPSANCIKVGDVAGWLDKTSGYRGVKVNYKDYQSHRLAFLYMEGYNPEYQVDHINGIRDDNRWENLRHVTRNCNMQNQKTYRNNKSGFTGVIYNKSTESWKSYIMINSRFIYLGLHKTALEAALVRYTVEVQCSKWTCNYRSELAKAIKKEWPQFNHKQ